MEFEHVWLSFGGMSMFNIRKVTLKGMSSGLDIQGVQGVAGSRVSNNTRAFPDRSCFVACGVMIPSVSSAHHAAGLPLHRPKKQVCGYPLVMLKCFCFCGGKF